MAGKCLRCKGVEEKPMTFVDPLGWMHAACADSYRSEQLEKSSLRDALKRNAQWSDKDCVVVFRDSEGNIRYPGRNDLPTPKGCERVEMRSLREVEKFERQHNVRSEIAWYDRGSGNNAEYDIPRRTVTEQQKLDAFMKGWRN